ncbi:hypothetical protein I79_006243 [Cricetulus griseus]|uniref:Uncharacterized protein n=1 Tax=Cricetulus griseus TaxID=10029 RepID=G3H7B4_CRIGR|nr:hypothetical protein I79_006243 [Cricetulus griseus]
MRTRAWATLLCGQHAGSGCNPCRCWTWWSSLAPQGKISSERLVELTGNTQQRSLVKISAGVPKEPAG